MIFSFLAAVGAWRRICSAVLVVAVAVWGAPSLYAQKAQIQNPDFHTEGLNVVVTYDLIGKQGKDYEVELLFSASGGESFDYEPQSVTGDVGKDISPGSDKRITWMVLQDFPGGLRSQNVQFKLLYEKDGGGAFGWFLASLIAGGGGTALGIATGVLPCLSFAPQGLCPADPDPLPEPQGTIPPPVGTP